MPTSDGLPLAVNVPGGTSQAGRCWADRHYEKAVWGQSYTGICQNNATTDVGLCEAHYEEIAGAGNEVETVLRQSSR